MEKRQFDLGGTGTTSGLGSLTSLFSDIPSLSSLGSDDDLSGLSDLSDLSDLDDLTTLPTSLSSLSSLATRTIKKRQFELSDSSLTSLFSDIPSLSSLSSSDDLSDLGDFSLPTSLSSLSSLTSDLPSFSLPTDLSSLSDLSDLSDLDEFRRRAKRATVSSTMNGVTENSTCEPLTLIFARGTGELGNMGTVIGPSLATELQTLTDSKVTIQGVNYDASIAGDATMGEDGGSDMATLVKTALSNCPDTKVVLGGYSEGAMVVHNAASSLTAEQVTAAVLFGDPLKFESVGKLSTSDVKEFCATGDPVCENGEDVIAHLSYGSDATTAATFLVKAAGLSTSS
ncbi:cutinase-domain-containing protein [Penicillium verhagenii]|uniref:cutinase-domain-containing protein n=1 Tax=Penicillium verhagenii TaxID=1562060 RepID=UPI002544FB73|nr:cutinase-domain-containing protein [Penicillium verhagenii]KAJ5930921.1 cutinase-domain-containing protein [Penicillium verhagenii]